MSFEADGDVTHAYWNEGDQITIYDESQGALEYQLATTDEASGTATFAPLGNSVQYTEETVYAIYPATRFHRRNVNKRVHASSYPL